MALPKLPGNEFDFNIGKEKWHKSHHFDKANNVQMWVGDRKPGIGGSVMSGQDTAPTHSSYGKGDGCNMPAWVAFDKQVRMDH